ncbi:MAG: hypothetical protein M3040_13055 [Bacteroidota bacterium]|nr:hypothetical protein [Bacteroidota bacterium]
MEVCTKCHQNVSKELMKDGVCFLCESDKQDTIEKLKARIQELEIELQMQKKSAEKGDKLLKVMWGDDFNDDSLH